MPADGSGMTDLDLGDGPADGVFGQAATDHLDLGKFWHVPDCHPSGQRPLTAPRDSWPQRCPTTAGYGWPVAVPWLCCECWGERVVALLATVWLVPALGLLHHPDPVLCSTISGVC